MPRCVTLEGAWFRRPPTDDRPACPCGTVPAAGIGCDHAWCPDHRAWTGDTGSGPSCCAGTVVVPLAFLVIDAALDVFGMIRARVRGVDFPCPRHLGEGVAVSWPENLVGISVLSTCGCGEAELLDALEVAA